jgi:hypothetical protein
MLARRIIAVSPDKAFGKQLATALKAAGGAVDLHASLDELGKGDLQAALVVLHLDGALATASAELLPRLTGDARVIAVLPKANLAAIVDIMLSSDRLAGMLIAEDLDTRELSAMATRVLNGDIFGLEKMISWGTMVHSCLVGDYQEKSLCIAQISEFAELMGVRRKYRESIEQCVDEMLMNALYDAPVDEQGKPIFSEIPTKTRISLRVEQKVVVQFACDGHRFAVSVRDAFGTLERSTVLRYLHKCLHAEQQIDRKVGGAGLGLYLMVNSATTVFFNVLPGIATEAVTTFNLDTPKVQLQHFGFFTEKIDAGGRLAVGASRRLTTGHPVERRQAPAPAPASRGLIAALSIAIAGLFVLIGIAVWQRLDTPSRAVTSMTFTTVPKGATIEIDGKPAGTTTDGNYVAHNLEIGRAYPVTARLDGYDPKSTVVQPRSGSNQLTFELAPRSALVVIESQPAGATVEIDGKDLGLTPLTLTALPPRTSVQITLKKAGFGRTASTLEVPGPGKEVRVVQALAMSEDVARVHIESEPPGAQVIQNGQLLAGVQTPADILVEAGKPQRFMLTLPRYVPAVIDPFTPARGGAGVTKIGKLVAGNTLRIESQPDGKVSVVIAPHCRDLPTPAECVVAPGTYLLELQAMTAKVTRSVQMANTDRLEKFELGYVEAGEGKQLLYGGQKVKKLAMEAGARIVTVLDEAGQHQANVRVKAGGTVVAN